MTVIDFANPPGILVLKGLPASGKTTLARQWVARDTRNRLRVNYADLEHDLFGDVKLSKVERDAAALEGLTRAEHWLMGDLKARSIVVDNLNLTPSQQAPWIDLARRLGTTIDLHEMEANLVECVRHDRYRGIGRVGEAVICRWALISGRIDWTDYKQPFLIVDVDGTLADTSHRQHFLTMPEDEHVCKDIQLDGAGVCPKCLKVKPKASTWKKDWPGFFAACKDDAPIQNVIDIITELAMSYHIMIVSGRPSDLCGIDTEEQLRKWKLPYEFLFMRNGGDGRTDVEVKSEILSFLPRNRIRGVFDDRPSVLRMYQDSGLTTFALGLLKEF